MGATLQKLFDRTRDMMRDTPDYDQLTASLTSSTTNVTVADSSIYSKRWPIEIDGETMMIRSVTNSVTLSVVRGWRSSTAVSHANSAAILMQPNFYATEIINAINGAIQGMYPYIYKPVVDTSLQVLTNQYQYVIPSMPGYTNYPIPAIYHVEVLQPGDYTYRLTHRWEVLRGFVTSGSPSLSGSVASTYPILKFKSLPPITGVIRLHGYGPQPPLVNFTDTLDDLFPPQCEYLLHKLAAGYLGLSAELGRARADSGPVDTRTAANAPGTSLRAAQGVLNRSDQEMLRTAMPPLPRHIKAVI